MVEQAEALIVRAAFKLISEDARVIATYPRGVRLLEYAVRTKALGAGTLIISAIPVKPRDLPTSSENIYVKFYLMPVFRAEETTFDSSLVLFNEYNEFRKLLSANTPLLDETDSPVSDDFVDIAFTGADTDWKDPATGQGSGLRIAQYTALYSGKINPATGDRIA